MGEEVVEREEVEPYLQTQNLKRQRQPEGPKQEPRHRGLSASFLGVRGGTWEYGGGRAD